MNTESDSSGYRASSASSTAERAGTGRRSVSAPAVSRSSQTRRLTLSYYPWITQSISGPVLHRAIADFVDLLQTELRSGMGEATQLQHLDEMEIPDQLDALSEMPSGDLTCKIALMNPLGYALIHKKVPTVESVSVIRRKIGNEPAGPTYKAQLYTHRKTFVKKDLKVKDVKGRSMAFGSPQSTSNFLVPAVMLFDADIHPLNGMSRVQFAGGHDKAASAVYEGRLEIGAGHDGVIIDLAGKPGYADAEQVLVRIEWSQPIPSDPVAIHTADQAVKTEVREALRRVASPGNPDSDGNKIVKRFWGTQEGFEDVAADAYDSLFGHMNKLQLRDIDMLRRL